MKTVGNILKPDLLFFNAASSESLLKKYFFIKDIELSGSPYSDDPNVMVSTVMVPISFKKGDEVMVWFDTSGCTSNPAAMCLPAIRTKKNGLKVIIPADAIIPAAAPAVKYPSTSENNISKYITPKNCIIAGVIGVAIIFLVRKLSLNAK